MKNTNKIISLSKEKSKIKIDDSIKAINEMKKTNQKITFYSVAKKAGVSTQFLYKNDYLRKLIEELRNE